MHRSVIAFILLAFQASSAAGANERPHVLFIVIDDLRPALGCLSDPTAITPCIDSLKGRGTIFTNAYCQQAVCSPSRLSFLTGRRPDTIKVWDLRTHFREALPDVVTLPQHFKNHGYHTRSIGKIFHGSGQPARDPVSWSEDPVLDISHDPELRYANAENLKGKGLKRASCEAGDVDESRYTDGVVCELAVAAIRKLAQKGKPFFLAVGFRKPHLPFCAPKKYWDLYDRDKIPLPASDTHPIGAPELAVRSWKELEGYFDIPKDGILTPEKVQELRHGYYACVSYVDALVGRLLAHLERSEILDETVICLLGDHGFHLGEQALWTKANNYEMSTRVPLILSTPQAHRGDTTHRFVELVDVFPTLADVCGLPAPEGVEGISFAPLIENPDLDWKTAVFSQFPRARTGHRHKGHGDIMGYAVRTQHHRYVEWREWKSGRAMAKELYDHRSDPREMRNLAGDVNHAETLEQHGRILKAGWRSAHPVVEAD